MRGFRILAVALGLLFIGSASGCADYCADLQSVCDRCTDSATRQACEIVVNQGNEDSCEALLANQELLCP